MPSSMTQVDADTGQAALDKKVMRIEDKTFSIKTSEMLRVEPGSAEPSHPNRVAWGEMLQREAMKYSSTWSTTWPRRYHSRWRIQM